MKTDALQLNQTVELTWVDSWFPYTHKEVFKIEYFSKLRGKLRANGKDTNGAWQSAFADELNPLK
jgi:hypothetical protein